LFSSWPLGCRQLHCWHTPPSTLTPKRNFRFHFLLYRYTTFITPEALNTLERYLEFRRDHGEILGYQSPLFRDKFDPVKGMYGHGKQNANLSSLNYCSSPHASVASRINSPRIMGQAKYTLRLYNYSVS
jgi:hypothetical protein